MQSIWENKLRYIYILLYYFQRTIKGYLLRDKFAKAISLFIPRADIKHVAGTDSALSELKKKGFSSLGSLLDNYQIEEINSYLSNYSVYDRYDKSRKLFELSEVPEWANTGSYSDEVLLHCPHIFSLANNPLILSIVSQYLEAKPTLSNITLWHSFPAKDKKPKNAEFYHRDVDDFKFVKVFIYLSDVGVESGPHVYVDGSKDSLKLLNIKRYSDEEVFNCFLRSNERVILGGKGDAFIEDTYGLHKGTPVVDGVRTVLQFEYSLLPFSKKNVKVKKTKEIQAYDSYINRLYI